MSQFEDDLVQALDPIRYHFLGRLMQGAMNIGLFEALRSRSGATCSTIAEQLALSESRLTALLRYFENEEIVSQSGGIYTLTNLGELYFRFQPWYDLLLGGYSQTLADFSGLLRSSHSYGERNMALVGSGSCGVSEFDTIPLIEELLRQLPSRPELIIELGCGDGSALTSLGARLEWPVRLIGVDPSRESLQLANANAVRSGVNTRAEFYQMSAQEYIRERADSPNAACFLAPFSLQEVLSQDGEPAIKELLSAILAPGLDNTMIVVEVAYSPTSPALQSGLGRAYYNPYHFLHEVTDQRLESETFWLHLFDEAGCEVRFSGRVQPEIDSTGLTVGWLLAECSSRADS